MLFFSKKRKKRLKRQTCCCCRFQRVVDDAFLEFLSHTVSVAISP